MQLIESLFEKIPVDKYQDIEDKLLTVQFTDNVDFDYDAELPDQLIIIPKHIDDFGHGSDYLKNHIEWKKNIIKTIKENGYVITDPVEDNDPYMYIVVEKKSMTESTEDEKHFEEVLKDVLDNEMGYKENTQGIYEYTLWADYNDQLSEEAIADILKSSNPMDELYEVLWNSYQDAEDEEYDSIFNKFIEKISDEYKDDAEEWYINNRYDYMNINPDYDHFLNQEVKAALIIDNGDSNTDFSSIDYTLDYTESGIDPTTGVAWLTSQQGHTVDEVIKEYADYKEGNGFVKSMAYELLNTMSSMNTVTFIGKTTLETLLNYKSAQAIKVDKGAMCGLFDAWYGSGSVFGIELEKDVIVPQKNIFYFGPDIKHDGVYSTDDVFGWAGSAYKSDVFELIGTNESLKEDLTNYSAGMKVRIKGDNSGKIYVITDVSKEDGVDLYNIVDVNNIDGDTEDEVYEFNELELIDRNIKEGYCLMERDWVKTVPKDLAKKFYEGLDNEDLEITAEAIRAICDWLITDCGKDCGIDESDVEPILDEMSIIDLSDADGLFSEPDDEDDFEDEETNADYFNSWVIDPLYDLLDVNSIWMPIRHEVI